MVVRAIATLSLAAALCASASSASAGVYGDDLGKCLVAKTTAEDQQAFIVWMFSTISAHPDVQGYTTLTEAQRGRFTVSTRELVNRLILQDCRKETIAAMKYEGPAAIEPAFGLFGQVAMRGLMSDPKVNAGFAALSADDDKAKYEAVMREAGLTPDATTPAK